MTTRATPAAALIGLVQRHPVAAGSATIAAALAMAVAALMPDEGKHNATYIDIAGIPTICHGHTGPAARPGARLTDARCQQLLEADTRAHLDGVLACVPALRVRPAQLAASTRLAFNIGVRAFCRSTAARRFNAGDWAGGCRAFLSWNKARVRGVLQPVRGLTLRRQREMTMCLDGLNEERAR